MSWVRVVHKDEIPVGSGRTLPHKESAGIAIFHLTDDRILALHNRCPHRRGPLAEGIVSGSYVFCPLHDWKIDLASGKVQEPDHGCVKTFPVKIEDGWIWVEGFT